MSAESATGQTGAVSTETGAVSTETGAVSTDASYSESNSGRGTPNKADSSLQCGVCGRILKSAGARATHELHCSGQANYTHEPTPPTTTSTLSDTGSPTAGGRGGKAERRERPNRRSTAAEPAKGPLARLCLLCARLCGRSQAVVPCRAAAATPIHRGAPTTPYPRMPSSLSDVQTPSGQGNQGNVLRVRYVSRLDGQTGSTRGARLIPRPHPPRLLAQTPLLEPSFARAPSCSLPAATLEPSSSLPRTVGN